EYFCKNKKNIIIKDSAVNAVCNGAALAIGGIVAFEDNIEKDENVFLLSLHGELVAFGKTLMTSEEIKKSERGLAVMTDRVIIPQDRYPKKWKGKIFKEK
ncbi:MAG: PUA domain-containing protein, partial [bacterium]